MAISVTDLKHRCLEIVRRVERTRRPVTITRRGRVVAHLTPDTAAGEAGAVEPWQRLRTLGGSLSGPPGASVLQEDDFEAVR